MRIKRVAALAGVLSAGVTMTVVPTAQASCSNHNVPDPEANTTTYVVGGPEGGVYTSGEGDPQYVGVAAESFLGTSWLEASTSTPSVVAGGTSDDGSQNEGIVIDTNGVSGCS